MWIIVINWRPHASLERNKIGIRFVAHWMNIKMVTSEKKTGVSFRHRCHLWKRINFVEKRNLFPIYKFSESSRCFLMTWNLKIKINYKRPNTVSVQWNFSCASKRKKERLLFPWRQIRCIFHDLFVQKRESWLTSAIASATIISTQISSRYLQRFF